MKLHKYLFIAAGMALAAGFTACDEGGLDYEYVPAVTPTGAQVYFDSADNGMTIGLADGQTEVNVPIYRVSGSEAITVNLTLTDESGFLALPDGGVTFAAGQKETTVKVGVNFSSLEANTKYPFTLTVQPDDASAYAIATLSANVEFAPWTEWTKLGTGTYLYDLYFSGADSGLDMMWRQSLIDENMAEFKVENVMYSATFSFSGTKQTNQSGKEVYILDIPRQPTGYVNSNYGEMVMFCDMYNYTDDPKYATLSQYDPETGEFAFALVYYVSLGVFGNGYEYFQLDGFASYEIDLNAAGHYVAPDGTDYALVQCHMSEGLGSVQYTAVAGNITEDDAEQVVADMIAGNIESKITEEANGYLTFTFPETGMYTVVAAGLDSEGEHKCTAILPLAYVPVGSNGNNVDDDPDWTTLGYCTYTDDFLTSLADVGPETYEVKIQENNEVKGVYRLVNVYGPEGYGFQLVDGTQNYFMYIQATDPDAVLLSTDDQGVRPFDGYGNMYTSCMAVQQMGDDVTLEDVKAAGLCGTMESGFIHFPENQLMIALEQGDKLPAWKANTNGAFEVDMSSLISEQRTYRTSVRRPVRMYGNPAAKMEIRKRSFLGNVTTKEIVEYNRTHLRTSL